MALTDEDKQWFEGTIDAKITGKMKEFEDRIVARINREVIDLAEVNRQALATLDNHKRRLTKLEQARVH